MEGIGDQVRYYPYPTINNNRKMKILNIIYYLT